jgi:hypothetical protein
MQGSAAISAMRRAKARNIFRSSLEKASIIMLQQKVERTNLLGF